MAERGDRPSLPQNLIGEIIRSGVSVDAEKSLKMDEAIDFMQALSWLETICSQQLNPCPKSETPPSVLLRKVGSSAYPCNPQVPRPRSLHQCNALLLALSEDMSCMKCSLKTALESCQES